MNKILLSVFVLFSIYCLTASGQQIPNNGFDNWSSRHLFSKPQEWNTTGNPDYAGWTTIRSEDAVDGNYSLKLTTVLRQDKDDQDDLEYGYAILGEDTGDMPVPSAWTGTVDKIHFSLKHDIEEDDAAVYLIQVVPEEGDNIDILEFLQGSSHGQWIDFSIPLNEGTPVTVTELLIVFTSSAPEDLPGAESFTPKAGSSIMVDNIHFTLGEDASQETVDVPNGSFEVWEDIESYDPDGWTSTNYYLAAHGSPNVTRITDTDNGVFAVRLETVEIDGEFVRGILSLGDGLWNRGGMEFTGRPMYISGVYKLIEEEVSGNENIHLNFMKEGEHFGGTSLNFPPAAGYTRFISPEISYLRWDNADYMYFQMESGESEGSVLYIDYLVFPEIRSIDFNVRNSFNEPIDGAKIIIEGIDPIIVGDFTPFYTYSDGRAYTSLPDGEFRYRISRHGYDDFDGTMIIAGGWHNIDVTLFEPFAGGDGSYDYPWEIENARQLDFVREYADKHFVLVNDIDLGSPPWSDDEGWRPIGNPSNPFMGSLDGNGFVIRELTINRPDREYIGLFGQARGAVLENIILEDVDINGRSRVGGLVGQMNDEGIIENSSVTGQVSGQLFPAGIAGNLYHGSVIRNSRAHVEVTMVSGTSNQQAGGLVGRLSYNSRIENSFFTGSVSGLIAYTGGLAGLVTDQATIENSYSTGDVTGESSVGGIAGQVINSSILRSYSTGRVTGKGEVGGLAGSGSDINFDHSYWNTETAHQNNSAAGEGLVISQMLDQASFINWDFDNTWGITPGTTYPWLLWQSEPGPQNYPPAHPSPVNLAVVVDEGKATLTWEAASYGSSDGFRIYRDDIVIYEAGDNELTYEESGLVNLTEYIYYVTAIYATEESEPSGIIRVTPYGTFASGEGTPEDPFLITTPDELNLVRYYSGSVFALAADIDLDVPPYNEGSGWLPIGSFYDLFTGILKGFNSENGTSVYKISNLYIDRPQESYVGLFGYLDDAEISGIKLENVDVTGNSYVGGFAGVFMNSEITDINIVNCRVAGKDYSGSLAGWSGSSVIKNIHSSGTVAGAAFSGGLSGILGSGTEMSDCSFEGNITGTFAIGGLTGINYSVIQRSHSGGSLISDDVYAGGLVGQNRGEIVQCFSTVNVQTTSHGGGLAGINWEGTISDSYAIGEVISSGSAGGFVNHNNANIIRSYSTGEASGPNVGGFVYLNGQSAVTGNSYWDMESSKMTESASGEGRTTSQMLKKSTFNQWDFENIWSIIEDVSYPWLQWQGGPGPHNYPPGLGLFIEGTYPLADDNQVPTDVIISVEFDRNILEVNNGTESVTLSANSANITISVSINDNQLTVTPAEPLEYHTAYVLSIPAGSVADAQNIDNILTEEFILTFTTEPYPDAPTLLVLEGLVIANKVYDGTTDGDVEQWGYLSGMLDENNDVSLVTAGANAVFASAIAGEDIEVTVSGLSLEGTDADRYIIHDQTASADIIKKALIVTAEDNSKVLGEADPAFTVVYEGFVSGETESDLEGTLTFSFNPADTSGPGSYDIIPGGLSSGNYDVSFVNGTYSVYVSLTLLVSPEGAGTVTGEGENFNEGDLAAISATANPGWIFTGWTDADGDPVTLDDGKYSMPVKNVTLTANFESTLTVTFIIEDEKGNPIQLAEITIKKDEAEMESITTDSEGKAETAVTAGDYEYSVITDGYDAGSGSFSVTDTDVEITVSMIAVGMPGISMPDDKLLVYPNPGDGQFTVEYSAEASSAITLEIINVAGTMVYAKEIKFHEVLMEEIDLRHVGRGVYFLRLRENGTVKTLRLIFR